ncbi:MAG: hypothetical protein ACK5JD_06225 [Mangrovibacterium sp.]
MQDTTPAICAETLNGTMTTFSGIQLDLMNPLRSMIELDDIATGLANKGHFSGQTPYYFSIAQHCILVCDEFCLQNPTAPDELKLLALLHDASEAYIGDMIKPLKVFMPDFVSIENRLMKVIAYRYDLPYGLLGMIKPYDLYVQNLEYNAFYRGGQLGYMDAEQSRRVFVDRFKEYYHGK